MAPKDTKGKKEVTITFAFSLNKYKVPRTSWAHRTLFYLGYGNRVTNCEHDSDCKELECKPFGTVFRLGRCDAKTKRCCKYFVSIQDKIEHENV